jgi:transcriptional regulator with XRE-family HTH domain
MNKLKVARVAKDLTMQQLADKLHVSRQAISAWEDRKSKPSVSKIMELHRVLDISLDDLMDFLENKEVE